MYFIRPVLALLTLNFLHEEENHGSADSLYTNFAVNTESEWASRIGKKILEKGGNALDAAIASCLSIGVVNSFSSGIGGGGFMLLRKKSPEGDIFDFIDFREVSPRKATQKLFIDHPEFLMTTGLSVAVPGEVLGLYSAHLKYGKLPWKVLFEDPIRLANGFKASKKLVEKLKKNEKFILNDPGLKMAFTKNGKIVGVGDIIIRKNLANTLQIIANDPMSFYKGDLGDKIVKFLQKNNGILEKSDLENYKIKHRPVLRSSFYDYDVITTSLPTSGMFIIEALKILERINIRDIKYFINNENSYIMYHIMIETFKFIFAERGRFGDPDFIKGWEKRIKELISPHGIEQIFKKFNLEKPLGIDEYGTSRNFKEDHGTTHLNVIDSDDFIVLITSTVNLEFGSKLLDPETGILFNNQMDDFYITSSENSNNKDKHNANMLAGGKRPFSSAAPTLLMKKNEIIAIGAAGGTRIPAAIISTIAYLFIGNTLENAISLCRIHNQLSTDKTFIEATLPDFIIEKLKGMGHSVVVSELNTSFTSVQAIQVFLSNNSKQIKAISDHRKDGISFGS